MRSCLVLDFDGTVLDTEEPVYRSWAELWSDHGQELTLAEWQTTIGTTGGFDPWDQLERRVGRTLDPGLRDRRRVRRDELQARHRPRPGIEAWLEEAAALGLPVGIASSSPVEWVEHHLTRLGLRGAFTHLACCDDVVPAKPDPTSYQRCCAALGAEPRLSVAVEDSAHGVAAARAAGLFVVAVPHALTSDMDLSAADLVSASLDDLALSDVLARAATGRRAGAGARPRRDP
jgi:HAD superfamily hydrolase (TIGR01509 family)